MDVIVTNRLLPRLKSPETPAPVHVKILLTYLRLPSTPGKYRAEGAELAERRINVVDEPEKKYLNSRNSPTQKKDPMTENELAETVIGLCLKIHRTLGPGLLESVYECALCYELSKAGIPFQRQKAIKVVYDDVTIDIGFRADVIVAGKLLLELKSSETIAPVHAKIVLTYLRLSDIKLGLVINFHEELLKNGIRRLVNNL